LLFFFTFVSVATKIIENAQGQATVFERGKCEWRPPGAARRLVEALLFLFYSNTLHGYIDIKSLYIQHHYNHNSL